MPSLNNATVIERSLQVYRDNAGGLRQARAAAVMLFQSKRPGWQRAQRLYFRAGQLLGMLHNKSIAHVV